MAMKLIVFGGTGQTGSVVLKLATECQGLEVSAFVRSPSKIPESIRSKLSNIVTGSVLNENDVAKALVGQNAVISCLGPPMWGGPPKLISSATKNIINAMRENSVKKLVLIGSGASLPTTTGFIYTQIMRRIPGVIDHKNNMQFLRSVKDIDWALVAPPWIKPGSYVGHYKTAINKIPAADQVTTYDLADWMLSYVQDDEVTKEYAQQFVGISSAVQATAIPSASIIALGILAAFVTLYWYFM